MKTAYAPAPGGIVRVAKTEVYSNKMGALRGDGIAYGGSDPGPQDGYAAMSAEEAESMLSVSTTVSSDFNMGGLSEYFDGLYLSVIDSSFSSGNWGDFADRRQ